MKIDRNIIRKEYNFSYGMKENRIYLGYAINNNFARCTGTSIYTVIQHNSSYNFSIEIISNDLNIENIKRFEELAKDLSIDINVYIIDISFLLNNNLHTTVKWPIVVYFRFLFPYILPNVDTLFYIDGDITCHGDISELFRIDYKNYPIAAVVENKELIKEKVEYLKLQKDVYFNSGMIVINCKWWRDKNILKDVFNLLNSSPIIFKTPDQDILNIIFNKNFLELDMKYNYPTWRFGINEEDIALNRATLIHFGGHPKPWQETFIFNKVYSKFMEDLYRKEEKCTPWANLPYQLPMDYKDRRLYAMLLFRKGKLLQGLYEFVKYSIEKFRYKFKI